MADKNVYEMDGSKGVTMSGVLKRHGFSIAIMAILGAGVGGGLGYLFAVQYGAENKALISGLAGFAGFIVVGGIAYALFHSDDAAEHAAIADSRARIGSANLKPEDKSIDQAVKESLAGLNAYVEEASEREAQLREILGETGGGQSGQQLNLR